MACFNNVVEFFKHSKAKVVLINRIEVRNKLSIDNHFNLEDWFSSTINIGVSTSIGFIISGSIGGILGLLTCGVDEYLFSSGIENKHYIARSAFWATSFVKGSTTFVNLYPQYKLLYYSSLFVLIPVISYSSIDFLDYQSRINYPVNAFISINALFGHKNIFSKAEFSQVYNKALESPIGALELLVHDIKRILDNDFLANFLQIGALKITSTMVDYLFLIYIGTYGQGLFINNLLTAYQTSNMNTILKEGSKVMSILLTKKVFDFLILLADTNLFRTQIDLVFQKSTELLLDGNNSKKLIASTKGKELINKLDQDLSTLLFQGITKLNSEITITAKFFIAFRYISNVMPEAMVPYLLTFLLEQNVLNYVFTNSKKIQQNLSEAETKLWGIKYHISTNMEYINLRDAKEYIKYKYNEFLLYRSSLNKDNEYLNNLKNGAQETASGLNEWIDAPYLGFKYVNNQINIAQIPLVKTSIKDIFAFLSSSLDYKLAHTELLLAKERIDILSSILSEPRSQSANHTTNNEEKIIFDNYVLMLDGKLLLKINYLEFQPGKHYAITGKSGCGKSAILIDLKQGLSGALSSSGTISLPKTINSKEVHLMFMDQNNYLPLHSTLLEVAFFPGRLSLLGSEEVIIVRKEVISLFKELEIDEFTLDEENNKGLISRLDSQEFKLSGGQSKKIAVIQAILNQPNILIADELTSGLDKMSIIKIEHALNKYLPNTMILSVEHHPQDNNYDKFYDFEVNFSLEEGVRINNLISKSSDINMTLQEKSDIQSMNICLIEDFILNETYSLII